MKKLEGRAVLCLTLAAVLIIGLVVFVFRLETNGDQWASFYANKHIYTNGQLAVGAVYDRDGTLLLKNTKDGSRYNDDPEIRKATLHVVGDKGYNIVTAANNAFRGRMVGYNFVTGTNPILTGSSRKVNLTIDADANVEAYRALAGRNGFVGVYNWKTGEIICMVSSPTIDPAVQADPSSVQSGTYINKVLSAKFTPGSTFKLVTTAAALENIDDINSRTFKCTGSCEIDGEKITCPMAHGTMDIYGALSNSCNCAYANLAVELGGDVMKEYTEELGLTSSYNINGIKTEPGSFEFDTYNINLGWAGIGQYEDQVNPLSMMVYMGAIAGGGKAAEPVLIKNAAKDIIPGSENRASSGSVSLLSSETAGQIKDMMRNNVKTNYGDANYPGLELHAKSGTAETGSGRAPHSWFCGFSGDYAFVVCVEHGGYGAQVAGPVAGRVLQYIQSVRK